MVNSKNYPNIDMIKTGRHLKNLLSRAGYSVKDIQEYLQLSCPQPIYRWYKGMILPSVDHLFMLSQLLNMHMEDLLIKKNRGCLVYNIDRNIYRKDDKRLFCYYQKLINMVS